MASHSNRRSFIERLRRAPGRAAKWLSDVGAAIVSPFERAAAAVTHKLFAVSEGFEGVESLLVRIGLAIIWPVRMLWRLLAGIGATLVPRSVQKVLAAPFHGLSTLAQSFGHGFMRVAESLNLDGVVLRLIHWTRLFWYPFAALGGFVHVWLTTRSFRQLLWGLPVFVVLIPMAAIAGWTKWFARDSVTAQYRVAINEAREEKDFKRVDLFERKLAQLGVETQFAEYQTAYALGQDGKYSEAYERMKRLAPADRPGYPPAHSWIVHHLLLGVLEDNNDVRMRLAKAHLDHLQTLGTKNPNIELWRALWLSQNKQPADAARVLEPMVRGFSPAAVMRMKIHVLLNKLDDARSDARWVRSHMEDRTDGGDALSPQDLNDWHIAERLLGNLPKAHSLAEQWLKAEPTSKEARAVLAELSQRMFDQALAAPNPDAERLAALFVQAGELAEDQSRLQKQVAALYRLRSRFPVADEVVIRIVDSPKTPATILEAVGTVAATVGELDKAKDYLQRAIKKDAQNSIAWNNFAWVLLQDPGSDLDEALDAVNKALAIRPDEFRYRETRGQVMVRLGRWQEAIADLEYAANGMPDSRDIHLSLAKAYDALGEKQLARVHLDHAE